MLFYNFYLESSEKHQRLFCLVWFIDMNLYRTWVSQSVERTAVVHGMYNKLQHTMHNYVGNYVQKIIIYPNPR